MSERVNRALELWLEDDHRGACAAVLSCSPGEAALAAARVTKRLVEERGTREAARFVLELEKAAARSGS